VDYSVGVHVFFEKRDEKLLIIQSEGEQEMSERDLTLQQAHEACLQEDYAKAYDLYEMLLKIYPNDSQILLNYGKALYNEYEDLEKAAHLFEQVLESEPNSLEALLWLADIAAVGYGPEQIGAASLYQRAIDLDPNCVDAYIGLGLQHNAPSVLLSLQEAIEAFRKATSLDPRRVDAHIDLAMALLENGNFAGARAAFLRALDLLNSTDQQKLRATIRRYVEQIDRNEPIKNRVFYNFSPRILGFESVATYR
jgi:tetratricopeptide (TPR) repeat protein